MMEKRLCRNVNRLFDTKGMNRISGKPLKTRDSGTLDVAEIPCLFLGLFRQSFFLILWQFRIHFFTAYFHTDSSSRGRGMFRSMPS